MHFPTRGKPWPLSTALAQEWADTYPDLVIGDECRQAKAWLVANPSRQKTPRGMPRFLVGWFNRSRSNKPGGHATGEMAKESALSAYWEEQRRRRV